MRRLLVLGALAVAVAGCGTSSGSSGSPAPSGGKPTDALEVMSAAVKANDTVQSMQMVGTMSEDLQGVAVLSGQPPVTMNVSGDISGVLRLKPLAGRLTISNFSTGGQSVGSLTELITPDAFFMRIPALAAHTGKPWLEMRFDEMQAASGFNFRQLMAQAEQMKPSQFVHQLLAAGDLHVVGKESVRGIDTTHYAGTVPADASLAQFSGSMRDQMAKAIRSMGLQSSDVDVWLDSRGLVRRARSQAHGPKASISMAIEVVAYNVAVDVTPPPASQTVDIAKLH